jgi:DNA-directed RNA polymerase specialized sigma24 family protein
LQFQTQIRSLVDRLNAGDTAALGEIWSIFGEHIRRRARNRLREFGLAGKAESMDICNSILLDMVKQESLKIQNASDVLGYFCRAIDNQIRSSLRALLSEKRDMRREVMVEAAQMSEGPEPRSTPSIVMMQREILEMIASALGDDGDEFVRLFVNNHSWIEIADRLGGTPDSVRMRWNRSVARVRSALRLSEDRTGDG